jgi:hypothetical protein
MFKVPFVVLMAVSNLLTATVIGITTPKEISSQQIPETQNYVMVKTPMTPLVTIPAKKRLVIPSDAKCPQWWQTAVDAGWAIKDLPTLDMVMHRESRCLPNALNSQDPNTVDGIKGSLGLTQLNAFWVKSTTYYPKGYLQSQNAVNNIRDLYDPYLNLLSALEVWKYGQDKHGCGWYAWATSCR